MKKNNIKIVKMNQLAGILFRKSHKDFQMLNVLAYQILSKTHEFQKVICITRKGEPIAYLVK